MVLPEGETPVICSVTVPPAGTGPTGREGSAGLLASPESKTLIGEDNKLTEPALPRAPLPPDASWWCGAAAVSWRQVPAVSVLPDPVLAPMQTKRPPWESIYT